ncbi:MAG: DUF2969 domain-containing protein [Limosilactobacillus sp.]|nr:DUF2969 domain-containing protein [Limosilactobacillus sp.]
MAKKDKNIEVTINDIERGNQPIQQVMIGKRLIGEVIPDNDRFKAIMVNDQTTFFVRSQEEGLAMIIQEYHLHQH